MESADKTNLLGKRKRDPKYEWESERALKEGPGWKGTTSRFSYLLQKIKAEVELLKANSEANLIPAKGTVQGLDETPHFVEGVAARKKTLIHNFSPQTQISNIIKFFKDVGKVVHVRTVVNFRGSNLGFGSVEFASANKAMMALEKKNCEYLCGKNITLGLAKIIPYPQRPRFSKEHKIWYEDHIRQEIFPLEEGEIPPHFFEATAAREETIFVANLSPQTKILHIIEFFEDVGEVCSVRLIVNQEGKHVGYGFVEFSDAFNAKKALREKNGEYLHNHRICLDGAKTAPNSPRTKYSLAEKLWYEDYLLRESLLIEEDETMEGLDESPNFVEAVPLRRKTLFIDNLSCQTKIGDIIVFFKDVAEVVHVRLIVNSNGELVGYGFVEFASADGAAKAREKKDGEYLCGNQISLGMVGTHKRRVWDPPPTMYCIDHKVWYEDYLRRGNLLIEEDEGVESLDELVEEVQEVSVRKKTLFINKLPVNAKMHHILSFFRDFGEVSVRLVVDFKGKHVGCGFVKFASAFEARKALQEKNQSAMCRHVISLDAVEIAPYPLRPKYKLAEKLWYEDY
ncbi:unnamed protein product [Cuscuta campestris]|uniref:RRM domain-containing protein n=1 Tax=Cuscuta campestris TaxID=132261 RepID=A0A484MW74_9ASTE|nr:unnamed protein product [Cuscuta campestris]